MDKVHGTWVKNKSGWDDRRPLRSCKVGRSVHKMILLKGYSSYVGIPGLFLGSIWTVCTQEGHKIC